MENQTAPSRRRTLSLQQRPALACAVLIAVGIALGDLAPCHPRRWLCLAAGLLISALVLRRRALPASAAIGLTIVLLGLISAQTQRYEFPADSIWNYTTDSERLAQLELTLSEPPRLLLPSPGELRSLPPKQVANAWVSRVNTRTGWRDAAGLVQLTIEQPDPRLAAGQLLRVTGILQRPPPASNPGEFDWAAYCRDQRILATVRVTHADGVAILRDSGPGLHNWLREKARRLLVTGFTADRAMDCALLRAFVLGDSDPRLRDLEDQFVRTGTVHDLAISGLHIAIIGGLALFLCRLLRMPPRFSTITALAIVALYAAVASPSWPGWRSIILCGAAAFGVLSRRSVDTLQMFFLAVALCLLIYPPDLYNGGFQVSFAAVLGMILFSNSLNHDLWAWWRGPDPRPFDSTRLHPAARLWHSVVRFIVATTIASVIAWLMVIPLIAYHFNQLNVWSVPAGVALLPFTVVALAAGVMKILLTLCWPSAAHVWAVGGAATILWIRAIIQILAKFPGASVPLNPPPVWLLVLYYGLFALPLLPMRRPIARRLTRLAPVAACAALMLASLPPAAAIFSNPRRPLQITLLSVGAGQCAVIRPVPDHAILIDAGSSTVSDVADALLIPYLRDQGCTHVDKIFLSHGDFDHISAAAEVFRDYGHPQIFTSPHFARHAVGNFAAESLLQTLRAARCPPSIIHQGDHLDLGNGAAIDVLWPPAQCDMNSNNCGLVLQLRYAGKTVLFPADIQEPPERALLEHPDLLRSDVLVAPHHGSAESTTLAFIRAIAPQSILASNDRELTHKQKVFDLIAAGYPLYRTHRCGAITLAIDPWGRISIQTYLNIGPRQYPAPAASVFPPLTLAGDDAAAHSMPDSKSVSLP